VKSKVHPSLCARYFYILKTLITFSFTSLEMRHYYQSPWDHQNDFKQSSKIITFTLKPYSCVIFQCHWLTERERERERERENIHANKAHLNWKLNWEREREREREDVNSQRKGVGCQILICKQCHLSSEGIGETEFQFFSLTWTFNIQLYYWCIIFMSSLWSCFDTICIVKSAIQIKVTW